MRFLARSAALIFSLAVVVSSALGQSPLNWEDAQHFDSGVDSSVSMTSSGLVIEFHKGHNDNSLWYHVGKVRQTWDGRYFVSWGSSHPLTYDGARPSVAISKEGYLVLTYTKFAYTGYGKDVQMRYWVGVLDPNGDSTQKIEWAVKDSFYDTGQYASLCFNTNDVLVDVHESAKTANLFYRIGHLRNPSAGLFDVVWDSGDGGIEYDKGANPHIALNQWNQVVEAHQTQNNESLLHYRRGHLYPDHISWTSRDSFRYDNDSKQPALAMTDQSKVIEVASRNKTTFSRTGDLRPNYARVDWSDSVQISWYSYEGVNPSVTTNGVVAISTWSGDKKLFYAIAPLR